MKKIIHRIFFNFDNTTDPFEIYLDTWKRELPDFKIMHWDRTNLPLDLNNYTKYMTQTKNHAFLSDYFRCWLLLKYGGMYLDADIEILNGDKLRRIYEECHTSSEYTLFLGIESNKGGLLTPHSMGLKCDTKHELLSFILNLYETAFSTPVKYFFLKFPIPDLFSLYFKNLEVTQKYTESTNGLFFNRSKPFVTQLMKIYPQDYFSPVITYNNSMLISAFSSNTCLCHHFAATWKQRQQNMGSFSNLLKSGYYTISDTVLSAIKSAYPNIPIKNRKPLWTLTKNELSKFEIFLNNCIPYESFLYQFFRKYFRKSYN